MVAATTAVIILTACAVYGLVEFRCGLSLKYDGGCVGLVGTKSDVPVYLQDIVGKIYDENERVLTLPGGDPSEHSRAVAFWIALPEKGIEDPRAAAVVRELKGAYLAQLDRNRRNAAPFIRVLVAIAQDQSVGQATVTDQILSNVRSRVDLVAVVGMGESDDNTNAAITALADSDSRVASVGARLTGDDLDPRLIRIAPTNSDQAAAAANYAAVKLKKSAALVLMDEKVGDRFGSNVANGFSKAFATAGRRIIATESFTSPGYDFSKKLANICVSGANMIYFAGRGADLADFVRVLPNLPCQHGEIDLMAPDTAVNFVSASLQDPQLADAAARAQVKLAYSTLAHPGAWEKEPSLFPLAAVDAFRGVSRDELIDGSEIMGYDATLTAIAAIVGASPGSTSASVADEFKELHGANAVGGGSGWISLSGGVADRKAVPIVVYVPKKGVFFDAVSSAAPPPYSPPHR